MKLSIIILYSTDRKQQLMQTLSCLRDIDGFSACQTILCVDGINNIKEDIEFIEIPRVNGFYCWANAINLGLERCKYDKVLYIDSDRILPVNFFDLIYEKIDDKRFCFPKYLYQFHYHVSLDVVKLVRDNFPKYQEYVYHDPRVYNNPIDAVRRKNPMSGCVAFTKKGYEQSGGFDDTFIGWGFPDIDYFMSTYKQSYEFMPINCNEFHLSHQYVNNNYDIKNNRSLMRLMGLYNGVKFCKKWNLPIHDSIIRSANELDIKDLSFNLDLCKFLTKYGQNNITLL